MPPTAVVAVTVIVCAVATLAGGVYSPEADIEPTCGEMDQTIPTFEEPLRVVENCCGGAGGVSARLAGATETLSGGKRVTAAVAIAVCEATLAAVMVTVCCAATVAGGVYRPEAEIEPDCGEMDHATEVLSEFETAAVNCCGEAADVKAALAGATEIAISGRRVTMAVAVLLGLAMLVAVTVTACCAVIVAGGV